MFISERFEGSDLISTFFADTSTSVPNIKIIDYGSLMIDAIP
jgi:hypothetical protein